MEPQKQPLYFYVDKKTFVIPQEKCDITLFKAIGGVLYLSTGEFVLFRTKEAAEAAWCYLQDAFKHKATFLQMQESSLGYLFDCKK